MDDIRKSINSILYDRIVSPLSGSFIVSWCIFNWRLIYVTVFQTNESLGKNKVEYIETHLNLLDALVWPTLSAIFFITIYPRLSEYAYQVSLFYKGRKRKLRNKYEDSQLLTIEQSIDLRLQLKSQLERFDKITSDKDKLISTLKAENEGLLNRLSVLEKRTTEISTDNGIKPPSYDPDYENFISEEAYSRVLEEVYQRQPVWSGGGFGQENLKTIKKLELMDLVTGKEISNGYTYTLTEKGKLYLKKSSV